MASNQTYKEYRVLELPTTGLVAGDRYYLNVGPDKYKTFIVSDNLVLTGEAGNDFIEKGSIEELRKISEREVWAIEAGYYKGVLLNGYYTDGDAPAIKYYWAPLSVLNDDAGAVVKPDNKGIGRFLIEFNPVCNVRNFGAVGNNIVDDYQALYKAHIYAILNDRELFYPRGTYRFSQPLPIASQLILRGQARASSYNLSTSLLNYIGSSTFFICVNKSNLSTLPVTSSVTAVKFFNFYFTSLNKSNILPINPVTGYAQTNVQGEIEGCYFNWNATLRIINGRIWDNNFARSVRLGGTSDITCERNYFASNLANPDSYQIVNGKKYCVYLKGFDNSRFVNNYITGDDSMKRDGSVITESYKGIIPFGAFECLESEFTSNWYDLAGGPSIHIGDCYLIDISGGRICWSSCGNDYSDTLLDGTVVSDFGMNNVLIESTSGINLDNIEYRNCPHYKVGIYNTGTNFAKKANGMMNGTIRLGSFKYGEYSANTLDPFFTTKWAINIPTQGGATVTNKSLVVFAEDSKNNTLQVLSNNTILPRLMHLVVTCNLSTGSTINIEIPPAIVGRTILIKRTGDDNMSLFGTNASIVFDSPRYTKNELYELYCITDGIYNVRNFRGPDSIDYVNRGGIANNINIQSLTTPLKPGTYVRGSNTGNTVVLGYPYENCLGGNIIVNFTNESYKSMFYHESSTNRYFISSYFVSGGIGSWTPWKEL